MPSFDLHYHIPRSCADVLVFIDTKEFRLVYCAP